MERQWEMEHDGSAHYLGGSDRTMSVYKCQKLYNSALETCEVSLMSTLPQKTIKMFSNSLLIFPLSLI